MFMRIVVSTLLDPRFVITRDFNLFFFFSKPASLSRLPLSISLPLAFPDTTEHRLSRRIRDRFNIGLGDTWFNKA